MEYIQEIGAFIKLKEDMKAECKDISNDNCVDGTPDGFVQLYKVNTLKMKADLDYQVKSPMINDPKVMCTTFKKDGK